MRTVALLSALRWPPSPASTRQHPPPPSTSCRHPPSPTSPCCHVVQTRLQPPPRGREQQPRLPRAEDTAGFQSRELSLQPPGDLPRPREPTGQVRPLVWWARGRCPGHPVPSQKGGFPPTGCGRWGSAEGSGARGLLSAGGRGRAESPVGACRLSSPQRGLQFNLTAKPRLPPQSPAMPLSWPLPCVPPSAPRPPGHFPPAA